MLNIQCPPQVSHRPHRATLWVLSASHKPITNSACVTLGNTCLSQAKHKPNRVAHWAMPVTSQSQIQQVSDWVLNASHKPATNSVGVTLDTKCQPQANHIPSRVSHWVLNACHKPATNSAGVTLGTKWQSQASHKPIGVTMGTKCKSSAIHKFGGCHTGC